jgi:cytochrome b
MAAQIIRIWDLPTRLFHWLLVIAVAGALITVNLGGSWMQWHGRFGLMVLGLLTFRLCWGLMGATTARFRHFVPSPRSLIHYLRGNWRGVGHNPLGALSILAMLGLLAFQVVTGLFAFDDIAYSGPLRPGVSSATSDQLSGWHRLTEWWIYGLVGLHVLVVLFYTLAKKDNLVGPMITGRKTVDDPSITGVRGAGPVAFVVALAMTLAMLWIANGALLPPPPPPAPSLGW